jgi:Uma2 family endonuclease
MVQTPSRSITLAQFLARPETQPASEYLQGEICQKPMPQTEHSAIQTDLSAWINQSLRSAKIGRAFTELRCSFGDRSIVADIAVLRWNRLLTTPDGKLVNRIEYHPDWIIEILSPGQSQTKVVLNLLHCLAQGAEMGWLIDPEESCVFVYQRDQTPQFFTEPDRPLPVPGFASAVSLTVEQLFAWTRL